MKKLALLLVLIAVITLLWIGCSPFQQNESEESSLIAAEKGVYTLPDAERCFNSGKQKPTITLKLATAFATGHILNDYCLKFKEIVEKITCGKITVAFESALDTEENVNIRCSTGDVDMQATGGYPLQVFAPQYFFFNAPYVIKDYDHFVRVWNGELGKEAKKLIKENGHMRDAGTVYRGLRQMTSNKPINGPVDLVGLKLRLPTVPVWVTVWSALETTPVQVPLTGLYNALATGVAEASEGDLAQIYSYKLYEVQSHLTFTNHLVAIGWIMINDDFFNKLPLHYKVAVLVSSYVACDYATEKLKSSEQGFLDQLIANGMTTVTPDAEAIRQKAKPAIEQLFATQWPVTTWDEVLAQ